MKFFKFFLVFILGLGSGIILSYFFFSWVSQSPSVKKVEPEEEEIFSFPETYTAKTGVPILMYHYIEKGQNSLYVSPSNFEEQMSYLYAKGYQTISLDELFTKSSTKNFVITFDDGYKDVIENAYPILKRLDFKATVFLIVNDIAKKGYLDWEDIKILEKEGWSFGSHGLNHKNLLGLRKEEAEKEIIQSKEELEFKLKEPVNFFSYPVGKFDQEIIEIVEEAGYKGAVTTEIGKDNTLSLIYQLKRIRISGSDTLESFIKKLK